MHDKQVIRWTGAGLLGLAGALAFSLMLAPDFESIACDGSSAACAASAQQYKQGFHFFGTLVMWLALGLLAAGAVLVTRDDDKPVSADARAQPATARTPKPEWQPVALPWDPPANWTPHPPAQAPRRNPAAAVSWARGLALRIDPPDVERHPIIPRLRRHRPSRPLRTARRPQPAPTPSFTGMASQRFEEFRSIPAQIR